MRNCDVASFVQKAEALYEGRLQAMLEADHVDAFVAIEPESEEYFLGATINEAAKAANESYPNRPTHVVRVGHKAALYLG